MKSNSLTIFSIFNFIFAGLYVFSALFGIVFSNSMLSNPMFTLNMGVNAALWLLFHSIANLGIGAIAIVSGIGLIKRASWGLGWTAAFAVLMILNSAFSAYVTFAIKGEGSTVSSIVPYFWIWGLCSLWCVYPVLLLFLLNSMTRILGLVALLGLIFGFGELAYFGHRCADDVILLDLKKNVTIKAGPTMTPDLICEVLSLKDGETVSWNALLQKRKDLLEEAPNIRDLVISRNKRDKLDIIIKEREPVAKVGTNGCVVDVDGVVFIRYAGTSALPLIIGDVAFEQVKPGDHLQGITLAAARLAGIVFQKDTPLQTISIDESHEDYLLLTLSGDMHAKIAWSGMLSSKKSDAKMLKQFNLLVNTMRDNEAKTVVWDATHVGRVVAIPQ